MQGWTDGRSNHSLLNLVYSEVRVLLWHRFISFAIVLYRSATADLSNTNHLKLDWNSMFENLHFTYCVHETNHPGIAFSKPVPCMKHKSTDVCTRNQPLVGWFCEITRHVVCFVKTAPIKWSWSQTESEFKMKKLRFGVNFLDDFWFCSWRFKLLQL